MIDPDDDLWETPPEGPGSSTAPWSVDRDGFLYDPETGEVHGRFNVPIVPSVSTEDEADEALRLRAEIEAEVAALDARTKALTDNLKAMRRRLIHRLSWWERRFQGPLTAFARSRLAGKSRTAQFAWGRVSFRTVPARSTILDEEAAVAWVEAIAPERVRVKKSVTLKDVLAASNDALLLSGDDAPLPFLGFTPACESVTILTGVSSDG